MMRTFMHFWATCICYLFLVSISNAGTSAPLLLPIEVDVRDHAALQRGAAMYMNYCSGCHSLKYMRYNRMAEDIGITNFDGTINTDLLVNNLIFTNAEPQSPIEIAMPRENSRQWFGVVPPDLSLKARERGPAWIYTYLKGFYADDSRPFGSNNVLLAGVAMPNVLAPLSGRVINPGKKHPNIEDLLLVQGGDVSENQFDSMVQDLVTFLTYVAEPAQLKRYHIGIGVMIFLFIFLIFAWLLKKSYWRNLKK